MKLHTLFIILLGTLIFTFTGCGGGSSSTSTPIAPSNPTTTPPPVKPIEPTVINLKVSITDNYQVESLGIANTINAKISLDNKPKSLYLLLSNYASSSTSLSITHNAKATKDIQSKSISSSGFIQRSHIQHAPQYIQNFSFKLNTLLSKTKTDQPQPKIIVPKERSEDSIGQSKIFYLNADGTQTTTATARQIISNVITDFGVKTLNIWVSNDSFDEGSGCQKSKCVTQDMVEQLANTFLQAGVKNDIYDWVTNIYEEEWGAAAQNIYSQLIPQNNEITILLTDIDNDNNPTGGVIGFFWSKDNIDKSIIKGSNERIMFYIDTVMFANTDNGDFWQKEIYSTLAHEFQHMINFYQKYILLDTDTNIWIDEMLSETTEDLIATKIQHIGSRGIEYTDGSAGSIGNVNGRYPLFNANNTLSITTWNNRLEDYSKVNAFGTYLIRNYGGAKLLHDIMHNTYTDEQAVVNAVHKSIEGTGKTFDNLLSEWGTAVFLSTIESPENLPTYNTGDFTYISYNGIEYDLGSINFFNYDPLPTIYSTAGIVQSQGNYYYKVGNNLTGDITINLELNGQTEATLIAK